MDFCQHVHSVAASGCVEKFVICRTAATSMNESASLEERADHILYYYSSCGQEHDGYPPPPAAQEQETFMPSQNMGHTTPPAQKCPIHHHHFSLNPLTLAAKNCEKGNGVENGADNHGGDGSFRGTKDGQSEEADIVRIKAEEAVQFSSLCQALSSFVKVLQAAHVHDDDEISSASSVNADEHNMGEYCENGPPTIITRPPLLETVHLSYSTIVVTPLENTSHESEQDCGPIVANTQYIRNNGLASFLPALGTGPNTDKQPWHDATIDSSSIQRSTLQRHSLYSLVNNGGIRRQLIGHHSRSHRIITRRHETAVEKEDPTVEKEEEVPNGIDSSHDETHRNGNENGFSPRNRFLDGDEAHEQSTLELIACLRKRERKATLRLLASEREIEGTSDAEHSQKVIQARCDVKKIQQDIYALLNSSPLGAIQKDLTQFYDVRMHTQHHHPLPSPISNHERGGAPPGSTMALRRLLNQWYESYGCRHLVGATLVVGDGRMCSVSSSARHDGDAVSITPARVSENGILSKIDTLSLYHYMVSMLPPNIISSDAVISKDSAEIEKFGVVWIPKVCASFSSGTDPGMRVLLHSMSDDCKIMLFVHDKVVEEDESLPDIAPATLSPSKVLSFVEGMAQSLFSSFGLILATHNHNTAIVSTSRRSNNNFTFLRSKKIAYAQVDNEIDYVYTTRSNGFDKKAEFATLLYSLGGRDTAEVPFRVPAVVTDDIIRFSTLSDGEDDDDRLSVDDGGEGRLRWSTCVLESCYLLPKHNVWVAVRSSAHRDRCIIVDSRLHKTVKHVQEAWSLSSEAAQNAQKK
jgi:hypothetical protein